MQAVTITQITYPELATLINGSIKEALAAHYNDRQIEGEKDKLLTIDEAAAVLSLSRQTIYGFVSRGAIPYMKRGKRLYFSQEELTKWLKEGRRKTNAEISAENDAFLAKR